MSINNVQKTVIIFEAEGGSDKGPDGHRKDTMPIIHALVKRGYSGITVFYSDNERDKLFDYARKNANAVISRINPGTLPSEDKYMQMLRDLAKTGVVVMAHPDAMIGYGAKDALVKLNETGLVPRDTYAYYDLQSLKENFPRTVVLSERVLKQNRGSTGEGIWRVQLLENINGTATAAGLESKIKCTEAKDNHVEYHTLGGFLDFCSQYLVGASGQLVDMRFLPRIKEGELRVLMIYTTPIQVIHKKPADTADAFSATLFSGAKYTYASPAQYPELTNEVLTALPLLKQKLGGFDFPLIWTMDFIMDTNPDGSDNYVVGEINCSCVGFTYDLSISNHVADAVVKILEKQ